METSSHSTFAWPNALSTAAQGFSTALSLHNAIPYGKRQGEQFSDPGKEYRLAVSFRDFRPGRGFASLVIVADVTLLMRFPKASLSPMSHLTSLMSKSLSALVDKSIWASSTLFPISYNAISTLLITSSTRFLRSPGLCWDYYVRLRMKHYYCSSKPFLFSYTQTPTKVQGLFLKENSSSWSLQHLTLELN